MIVEYVIPWCVGGTVAVGVLISIAKWRLRRKTREVDELQALLSQRYPQK